MQFHGDKTKDMTINTETLFAKLNPIFQSVFDDDELVVEESTTAADIEGWDSLAHIRLMVTIEKAFGVRFTASEIADLEDVGGMAELISKKQSHA